MPHKIMVVDDEPDLVQLITHHLQREGYEPISASTGTEAIEQIGRRSVSLVILDLMLPGEDGLQVCKRLRSQPETASLPIIILTAKDRESDKIVGLELGADDYITKPFSTRELMARVKSLLRRSQQAEKISRYAYGDLTLDLARHEVKISGEKATLTAKEFSLLEHFLKHRGRVLTREQILNDVWGIDFFGTGRTVDVHIRRLREKIPFLSNAIETIPSLGYKLADES
jgi:two-component system alkaline phosphatase synthesis response regulator PhoP